MDTQSSPLEPLPNYKTETRPKSFGNLRSFPPRRGRRVSMRSAHWRVAARHAPRQSASPRACRPRWCSDALLWLAPAALGKASWPAHPGTARSHSARDQHPRGCTPTGCASRFGRRALLCARQVGRVRPAARLTGQWCAGPLGAVVPGITRHAR